MISNPQTKITDTFKCNICCVKAWHIFRLNDEEYQEFLGRCQDLHNELEHERQKHNFTFAELDENEAELVKLQSWLPKIYERDLFEATGYGSAIEALKLCEQGFQQFSQQVYDAQDL